MKKGNYIDLEKNKNLRIGIDRGAGSRYVKLPKLIQYMLNILNDPKETDDIYNYIFQYVIDQKMDKSTIEENIKSCESVVDKGFGEVSILDLILFNYDPITGEKIQWPLIFSELRDFISANE